MRLFRHLSFALLLALFALPVLAEIQVDKAWVRAAPPGAGVTAGYMQISNTGGTDITLTGAHSPQFARVEFHATRHDEHGTASMVQLPTVSLAPGETQAFNPGGQHLMLIGPQQELAEGDSVEVIISTEAGDKISVTLPVRRAHHQGHSH